MDFSKVECANTCTQESHAPEIKSALTLNLQDYGSAFCTFDLSSAGPWQCMDFVSSAREGFIRNPVASRCIRLISEAMGSLKLVVRSSDGGYLDEHPILQLLRRPNQMQGGSEFLGALTAYYLVAGEAYVHGILGIDGLPIELNLLRPDTVALKQVEATQSNFYRVEAASGRKDYPANTWSGDNASVLAINAFNPLDEARGMSPLQAAKTALQVHNAASTWNLALLENSARPSGALVFAPKDGGNLTDDQFSRLKSELESNYTGARAAGRPLVLEGGLDWKAMGFSPKDMDFIEAKQAAAREIALALGVPPMLLGLPGDNTYSNYQEANRAFWRQTVVPLARRIFDSLSAWLEPVLDEDIKLAFDPEEVAELASDREKLWQRYASAEFLTVNEKRAALGFGPIDDETLDE